MKIRFYFHTIENKSDEIKLYRIIISKYKTIFYDKFKNYFTSSKKIRSWANNGKTGSPPQPFRHKIIKLYAKKFLINIFVETGTYLGNTINAVKNNFKRIYSIELNKTLYLKAKEKFLKDESISIILGDSSVELPKILDKIIEPCIFWLDAHYSGGTTSKGLLETPIIKELFHIFNHPVREHIILIDDAHDFTGENDYPLVSDLKNIIIEEFPEEVFIDKEDIIRIYKKLNKS